MTKKYHPYHMVTNSPWPILMAVAAFITAIGATLYLHAYEDGGAILFGGIVHIILLMALWWRDVIREATFEGMHTKRVQAGTRLGFSLFIVSEIMFFFGFFLGLFPFGSSSSNHYWL